MREDKEHRITGKIILHATLTNLTPVLIGKGEGETTDVEIIRLPNGQPYIPASSIAGCLQQRFITNEIDWNNDTKKFTTKEALMFWGSESTKDSKEPTYQSHIIFDDLITTNATAKEKIVVRDGVRISHQTNVAEPKGKYDYQLLEPEVTFHLRAEVTLREGKDIDKGKFKTYAGNILFFLTNDFRIGAHTNTGFGKMSCEAEAWYFDFTKQKDREAWFVYIDGLHKQPALDENYFNVKPTANPIQPVAITGKPVFRISADFKLKSSLIIGAYGIGDEDADKTHLQSFGKDADGNDAKKNVLTGKSIRGALRHRALKILNTLNINDAEGKIKSLFGYVENDKTKPKEEKKGRLRIEEENFTEGVKTMIQNRNKIDRFTGGTVGTALFNSEPVWREKEDKDEKHVSINLTLTDFENNLWEPALLLQLLKDLWTTDLPIGGEKNIGRGILIGQNSTIKWNGTEVLLKRKESAKDENAFLEGDTEALNLFSNAWEKFINHQH